MMNMQDVSDGGDGDGDDGNGDDGNDAGDNGNDNDDDDKKSASREVGCTALLPCISASLPLTVWMVRKVLRQREESMRQDDVLWSPLSVTTRVLHKRKKKEREY